MKRVEREMYALTMDELPRAGFEQYELSNFAQPGFRCRHNEVYWAGRPFFGFGPGAARYAAGRRELNHRSVTTWINRVLAGHSPIADSEELSPEERARELVMLNLRRCDGLATRRIPRADRLRTFPNWPVRPCLGTCGRDCSKNVTATCG